MRYLRAAATDTAVVITPRSKGRYYPTAQAQVGPLCTVRRVQCDSSDCSAVFVALEERACRPTAGSGGSREARS